MTDTIYEPSSWRVVPLLWMRRFLRAAKYRGRFRIGNIVAHAMLPNQKCVLPNAHGHRMVFDLNNIHEVSMFLDLFAEKLSDILSRTLRKNDCFLDCGANVGYFTFLSASIVGPGGKVISIDANPYCAQRITESRDMDKYPQVEILQAAVARDPGEMMFNIADDPMYSSISDLNQTSFTKIKEEIIVPVINLDTLTRDHDLTGRRAVRLAKVDVEGAEIDLLKGAENTLRNEVIDFVYIELHDQQLKARGQGRDEVEQVMNGFGYRNVYQPTDAWVVYQSHTCRSAEQPLWPHHSHC